MPQNVCRLCVSTNNLLWVFDETLRDNMSEIIEITSGVKISRTDTVSQMVCNTCCQLTIKMYKFRTSSIKNDIELKAKCAGRNVSHVTSTGSTRNVMSSTQTPALLKSTNSMDFKYKFAHPSVQEVVQKYPNIILPNNCLRSHIGAYITLLTDEVDEWYKERNYTDKEIVELKKEAYELFGPIKTSVPRKRRKTSHDDNNVGSMTSVNTMKRPKINKEEISRPVDADSPLNRNVNHSKEVFSSPENSSMAVLDRVLILDNKLVVKKVSPTNVKSNRKPTDATQNSSSLKVIKSSADSTAHKVQLKSKRIAAEVSTAKVSNSSEISSTNKHQRTNSGSIGQGMKTNASLKANERDINLNKSNEISKISPTNVSLHNSVHQNKEANRSRTPLQKGLDFSAIINGHLNSMLGKDSSEKPKTEDITLKTILRDSMNVAKASNSKYNLEDDDDDDIIEVFNGFERSTPSPDGSEGIEKMFDIQLSNTSTVTTPNLAKGIHNAISRDSPTSSSSILKEAEKNSFAEALELAPKGAEPSNQPDLSLVSFASKSYTLHTCKVCDSQHASLKDLKYHERKTHTKCPFCNKRFRSLASRAEHINNSCSVNNSVIHLKAFTLALVRVDEDKEICKKYASAFKYQHNDNNNDEDNASEQPTTEANLIYQEAIDEGSITAHIDKNTNDEEIIVEVEGNSDKNGRISDATRCDAESANAISQLEQFLTSPPCTSSKNKENDEPYSERRKDSASRNVDVICISDDESDVAGTTDGRSTRNDNSDTKINVIDSDILTNINIHDNDFNILKRILSQHNVWSLPDSPILDGNSNRVKIFKNLRQHLNKYKIPIEVKYSSNISVEYKSTKTLPPKKCHNLWYNLKPIELKPAIAPKSVSEPNTSLTIGGDQTNITPSPVAPTPVIREDSICQKLLSNPPIKHQTTVNKCQPPATTCNVISNNNTTTTAIILPPHSIVTQQPKSVLNKSHTITTSAPSNSSVLLTGGNLNINAAFTPKITNFILVPNSMLSKPALVPTIQGCLPVIESVSSGVESSAVDQPSVNRVAELESITNSLMPAKENASIIMTASSDSVSSISTTSLQTNAPTHNVSAVTTSENIHQPAIRVKDLKQLF